MIFVAVFGLRCKFVLSDFENGWIAESGKSGGRSLLNDEESTFVADFFAGQNVQSEVKPSVTIGVCDGFGQFMRKRAIGGIDELTVRSVGANGATFNVLKRLDCEKNMPIITKGDAAVVGAKGKAAGIIG